MSLPGPYRTWLYRAMNTVARFLASVVVRHPVALVAGTMACAFALSWGIPRLEFQTGQDTLISPSSKVAQDNQRFQDQFGGEPMLVLFEMRSGGGDIARLFTAQNRAEMRRFEQELLATGNYEYVLTPLLIVEYAQQQIARRMQEEPARTALEP